jgi:cellulose synthase/poly-beta-1,6-N-acetylglucosamine synthase-like glycosyltransferase
LAKEKIKAPQACSHGTCGGGSFPSAAFEDIELCYRVRQPECAVSVRLAHSAVVFHDYHTSLWGLVTQFFRYGRSEHLMTTKHPGYLTALAASGPCHLSRRTLETVTPA